MVCPFFSPSFTYQQPNHQRLSVSELYTRCWLVGWLVKVQYRCSSLLMSSLTGAPKITNCNVMQFKKFHHIEVDRLYTLPFASTHIYLFNLSLPFLLKLFLVCFFIVFSSLCSQFVYIAVKISRINPDLFPLTASFTIIFSSSSLGVSCKLCVTSLSPSLDHHITNL